uniref:Inhibitor I9 domain-containing protein n=1 Tax=Steinernema glaseri TaxID=37863 RepID=A0A1I7ZL97_9BILA
MFGCLLIIAIALTGAATPARLYVRQLPDNLIIKGIADQEVLIVDEPEECAKRWISKLPKAITYDSSSKNCTGYFKVIRGTKAGSPDLSSFLLTVSDDSTCPLNVM